MIKLLVLALLNMQPMSGYEIKGMLEQSDAQRWAGILPGSIYNALKKLEQAGYIEVASIEKSGHRQKAIYRITTAGRSYQRELLQETLRQSNVNYPTDLYASLGLLQQLPKAEALQALQENRYQLVQEARAIEEGLQAKKLAMKEEIPALNQLVFTHMFETIDAQLRLIDAAIHLLELEQ